MAIEVVLCKFHNVMVSVLKWIHRLELFHLLDLLFNPVLSSLFPFTVILSIHLVRATKSMINRKVERHVLAKSGSLFEGGRARL